MMSQRNHHNNLHRCEKKLFSTHCSGIANHQPSPSGARFGIVTPARGGSFSPARGGASSARGGISPARGGAGSVQNRGGGAGNVHRGGSIAVSSEDSSSQDSNASAAHQDGKNHRRTLVEPIALSDDDSEDGRGTLNKSSYRGRGFGSGEIGSGFGDRNPLQARHLFSHPF